MPSANVAWGIEVGAGAIKALKLGVAGDRVSVLDFGIIPHPKVLSTPGLNQEDAMRVALGALVSQFDLSGATIAVSVPGHSAFARFAKLPPVEPKRVPDIVKFEAVQQIPFPLDEVEWDYQTFVSPESPEVEVGIFAITRQRVMERLAMLQDVHLVPDLITLSPVAVYNALAYDLNFDERTPGTVVVDVGTTSTDLIVAEAGRVWIRTFPIGGHQFTESLVEAFKLSYPKAEKLKREAEQGQHARHVFKAMRPVFSDLAQDIQRSIGYYQSLHRDAKLVRLIGLGSTFMLPGMRRYLKQQLQMNIYRLEEFKRIQVEGPRAGEFQQNAVGLATAYGLALQGLGLATLEANLMPRQVLRETMWRRKVVWFGVAAALAVAASAAMFIRPFLDQQAVMGAPPPQIIPATISRAEALKRDAADVTGGAAVDYTAANLMSLTEERAVHGFLLRDVSEMLADADRAWTSGGAERREGNAFTLVSLTTDYLAPGAPEPGASRGRDEPAEVDENAPRRIRAVLTVSTNQPQAAAQQFVISTLDSWLRRNAQRSGVPYRIVVTGSPFWRLARPVERIPDAAAQQASAPAPNLPPQGRPIGPGRGTQLIGAGEGGGALEPPPNVNLGPLPNFNRAWPPGSFVTTFDITWTVELLPPAGAEGEREGA